MNKILLGIAIAYTILNIIGWAVLFYEIKNATNLPQDKDIYET